MDKREKNTAFESNKSLETMLPTLFIHTAESRLPDTLLFDQTPLHQISHQA
jgi:hypothetical protein